MLLAAAFSAAGAGRVRAQDVRTTLRGVVVAADAGERVPYAVVVLDPGFSQRFADETGAFAFVGVAPGTYRLLVRQVGFTPFDTTLTVSVATPPFRVELRRVAVELAGLTVRAIEECTTPGPPDPAADPQLAAVFDQLRQNAERYRLLSEEYPFRYRLVRRLGDELRDGGERVTIDTMELRSNAHWPYRPGYVVTPDPDRYRFDRSQLVHLPTLADFADVAFQRTHCFRLAGLDSSEGRPYVRLDFRAAKNLRSPDIDGAVLLDPASYQVRHTTVLLTRAAQAAPRVTAVRATAAFREIVPNLIVIERMNGFTALDPAPGSRAVLVRLEEQKLINVQFLRPLPAASDSTRRP